LYGVDGCRGGWIVAESDISTENVRFHFVRRLRSLLDEASPGRLVAIDIPIGLPKDEPRSCDLQARKLLGWPRRSSVFPPPVRGALLKSFPEACRINLERLNTRIPIQTFHIMDKIHEVDVVMNRRKQRYVHESHPEVTFAQLNGGRPMLNNKKTFAGRVERIRVLENAGIDMPEELLRQWKSSLPSGAATTDDLLDAMACLVTARHIHAGSSHSLGRADQEDAKGLLMEIVTCDTKVLAQSNVKETEYARLHG